ncbi:MAG: CorA family divalent cation transporter [bacterium]
MLKKYTFNKVTWVDVENPTKEDIDTLLNEYNLDPEIAQELTLPTYKPRVKSYGDYLYMVLHFPAFKHSHGEEPKQEIDFVIGKDFIITGRYNPIDQLEKVIKIFEVNTLLNKNDSTSDAGHLFYFIIKELFKSVIDEIDFVNDSLKNIERKIFQGKEKEMVIALSKVSRNLLEFKNIIMSQNETITNFEQYGRSFFNKNLSYSLSNIVSEHYKIEQSIEKNIILLQELRETNNSLLSTKQNEIMKTLTIITFIVMPFSIVNGFFQILTVNTPLIGHRYDWYLIVGTETFLVGCMYTYARKKKWF